MLLLGDTSTGKSQALRLLEDVHPYALRIDDITEASLVGIATRRGFTPGVLEKMPRGLLLIHEFHKLERKLPRYVRQILDCDTICVSKFGFEKKIKAQWSVVAAANPKDDVFKAGSILRLQTSLQEGILSRFDCIIPLMLSPLRIKTYISLVVAFDEHSEDTAPIAQRLNALCNKMQEIEKVIVSEKHIKELKSTFLRFVEERTADGRPLVIPRDFASLCRLVNTIACANCEKRKVEDRKLHATSEDVFKAIQLWEQAVHHRLHLYSSDQPEKIDARERILEIVKEKEQIPVTQLREIITTKLRLCSRATFYRIIDELVNLGLLKKEGKRDAVLSIS